MKIALYVSSWPPANSATGIATYVAHIVPALRKLGHRVFILTPNAAQDGGPWVIDIRKYFKSPPLWRRAFLKFREVGDDVHDAARPIVSAIKDLVSEHQIDVFEMEESFGWSDAISTKKIVPVVVRLHGPWFLSGKFDLNASSSPNDYTREKNEERGIRSADYVTAPSNTVLDAVKSHYGIELPRSISIPNPLDAVDCDKRWNVKTCDRNSLLYIGRFDELKGGDLVVRAFGELAAIYSGLKLTFVGPDHGVRDSGGEIVLFEQYARAVLSKSAMSRVTFLGKLPHSEISLLRTKHFLTICASQSESFGYTALEALSYGCPIVATEVGGVPSIIQNGRNGYLVPSQNLRAMVSACQRLFEDSELAARLGEAGWLDCGSKFGSDDIAKRTVQAYLSAIDSFKSRR